MHELDFFQLSLMACKVSLILLSRDCAQRVECQLLRKFLIKYNG